MVSRNTWYIGIAVVAVVLIAAGLYYSGMIGAPTKYDLTIQVTGQGTTNPAAGTQSTNSGTVVVVTATPATGWDFVNWQLNGQNSTTNPISVTVTANSVLKAFFKPEPPPVMSKWSLAIQIQGQGTTNPAAGTTQVNNAESVTITPTPAASWVFDHWVINGQSSMQNPLTLTMDTDYSVTAVFTLGGPPVMGRWSLAIQVVGQGTTNPGAGITQVTNGATVVITPTAASYWVFDHWVVNGQNQTTTPLTLTMNTDYSVTAVFKVGGPPVMSRWSLAIAAEGGGTTNPVPGVMLVPTDTVVTVTAIPDTGKVFDHWVLNGVNMTTNPIAITMTTDYSLTAVFR